MCGIFGAFHIGGFFCPPDLDRFIHLTDMVAYRGPDSSGYKTFSLKASADLEKGWFDIFLGHRRLAIIDLSPGGRQPLTDGEGLWIVFNGEIFNYVELREELRSHGHLFKTETDIEVILKVYKEYGEDGFDRLNGMWAFCLVDLSRKRAILSRDRFSIKPLYYTQVDNSFYFGSEIKQLLPLLKVREIHEPAMFKYLEQALIDYGQETFYRGVSQLKSKSNLVVEFGRGTVEQKPYWSYHQEEAAASITLEEAAEKFRDLFVDSVRIRLRSDVKVGALLSGGLDSSSVSIIANDLQAGHFHTYSIISKYQKYSEEKFVDLLSRERGIQNTKIVFDVDQEELFLGDLDKILYHNDEPFGGFSVIAQYRILQALKAKSDITVVLSGQGGDEILMGYLKYFFFNLKKLVQEGKYLQAFEQFLASLFKRTVVRQFRLGEARRYLPLLQKKEPMTFLKIKSSSEPVWAAGDLRERQISDIDKYSVPALTHYEDRNSMAHSLETRLPFLDHRLVDFVLNLPVKFKLRDGWTKYILRHSLQELPAAIRWRRDKQGFTVPEELWLKKDLSPLIQNIFSQSRLDELGIIDAKKFLEYYHAFQSGKRTIWHMNISRVFLAEMWARKYFESTPAIDIRKGELRR